MYSPLMGNLRALGHSRAAASHHPSSSNGGHSHAQHAAAPADPAAPAYSHQPVAGHASGGSSMRPEIPTFAGLATTTVLDPHLGLGAVPEADVAAAMAAAAAAAHECHWQALLLGGCPPVPEEGAVQWAHAVQATGAAAAAAAAHAGEAAAPTARGDGTSRSEHTRAPGGAAAGDSLAGAAASAALSSRSHRPAASAGQAAHSSSSSSSEAAQQQSPHGAAAPTESAAAAAEQLPGSGVQLQQRRQQHSQLLHVEVPACIERDVVERGPVLPPASLAGGPPVLSPHRQRTSSPTRQLSPLAAAAAAALAREAGGEVGASAASSPLLTAAEAGAPVGPLTASSPTRLHRHRGQHTHGHSQGRAGAAAAAAPRFHHQQQQQHSQQPPRHRSRPMSPGRAAAIEAAAASVAAHVAAAAQLIKRQEQRLSNTQLLLQPEPPSVQQPQQQQQQQAGQPAQQEVAPLRRQQSQGVQVQLELLEPPTQQQVHVHTPTAKQQQQQPGGLELDCSLCCFSPTSADMEGGWIREASPNALVAAASATVDTLMQQAEQLGMECAAQKTHQQQQQQQRSLGVSSSSMDARLHGTSSSDMGLLSPSGTQQQQQQQCEVLPPAPAPSRGARQPKTQRTPGSHHKRRNRSRWHQSQHNPLFQQKLGEAVAELQPEHRTPPRSGRSTSRSRHHYQPVSAAKLPEYRTARTPPMSPGAAAALQQPEELMVSTYQNPLLALEAAGLPDLGSSLDTELVSAALMPALAEQLAQQASEASSFGAGGFGLQGCAGSCDAAAGVSAAAVPVHMTPLAKERSVRVLGAQQGGPGLSKEGSGAAGGQLHWNPLYNPSMVDGMTVDSLQ